MVQERHIGRKLSCGTADWEQDSKYLECEIVGAMMRNSLWYLAYPSESAPIGVDIIVDGWGTNKYPSKNLGCSAVRQREMCRVFTHPRQHLFIVSPCTAGTNDVMSAVVGPSRSLRVSSCRRFGSLRYKWYLLSSMKEMTSKTSSLAIKAAGQNSLNPSENCMT